MVADPESQGRGPAARSAAIRDGQPAFPKRFYQEVEVRPAVAGFALVLDGKPARTPARNPVVLPSAALGHALTAEWLAVGQVIDPRLMPITRLVNTVLDGVSRNRAAVLAEIDRFAASDLLLYRAEAPDDLVRLQREWWDPITDWSREELGAPLLLTQGLMHVAQPAASLQRLTIAIATLAGESPATLFRVGALHVMTTLTGSALLAAAVGFGRLSAADAWKAAHVDEDFQISRWGEDAEAAARRANRWADMKTASDMFRLA